MSRRRFELPCTVEIENTAQSLHAHVEIDGDFRVGPGDEVQVIDPPERPPFGDRIVARRTAVVTRAGALERLLIKAFGDFGFADLYDVSFTERRFL